MKIDTRIQDAQHLLNRVDDLNRNGNLYEKCLLVSFHVVNMFPSIDNKMGIESVNNMLLNRDDTTPSAECIIETLELCLNCKNSIFNNQHYLQVDGTAQGPDMYCLPLIWLRNTNDIFFIWTHGEEELTPFLKDLYEFHPNLKCTYQPSQNSVDFFRSSCQLKSWCNFH